MSFITLLFFHTGSVLASKSSSFLDGDDPCKLRLSNLTESARTPFCRVNGWVDTPTTRGTWDILWTCLVTIFVCTYTILCLNVPAPSDRPLAIVLRRLFWMLLALVAPEIVLTYAAGQWSRARQSVEAFRSAGYQKWSMRMAFFADMGGFSLHLRGFTPFPVNAKQLHWLVTNGHVLHPEVSADEMWDKSKQDSLTKVITAFQIAYLIVQCIGRAAQNLPITILELNTLAIVVCSLLTSFTWLHKPSDVRHPIRLDSNLAIHDLIEARHGWYQTPLDFVDANTPGWSLSVQPFMGLPVIPAERPIQRIPNDRFPTNPHGAQEYFLCFATLLFTAIHLAGWNFTFPSWSEQVLWRACSLVMFGVTAAFWILETIASWVRLGRWTRVRKRLFGHVLNAASPETAFKIENETLSAPDPTSFLQSWEFWTITPIALVYGLSRLYLLLEAFLELRSLEASAYVTVNWSTYLPHI